jgi:predicted XRE-type DNA-binding protein
MTRKWKRRKPRKTRKGGANAEPKTEPKTEPKPDAKNTGYTGYNYGTINPALKFGKNTGEFITTAPKRMRETGKRRISNFKRAFSSPLTPAQMTAEEAAQKARDEVKKYKSESRAYNLKQKRFNTNKADTRARAENAAKKAEEESLTESKIVALLNTYREQKKMIKAKAAEILTFQNPADKEIANRELKKMVKDHNDNIFELFRNKIKTEDRSDSGTPLQLLEDDGSPQKPRTSGQKELLKGERTTYAPKGPNAYMKNYPKKLAFLYTLETFKLPSEPFGMKRPTLIDMAVDIQKLEDENDSTSNKDRKTEAAKELKEEYSKIIPFIKQNGLVDKYVKQLKDNKLEKELKYYLRDLTKKGLENQINIWKLMVQSDIGVGMMSTKKSKFFQDMLNAEQKTRNEEYKRLYKADKDTIMTYLNGEKKGMVYTSTSKESDVFLRRAVRLFHLIKKIENTDDLKFFTRIILCIIYKFYKNPDDPTDKQPFVTEFNINEVKIDNLTKFKLGVGDKHALVNALFDKLRTSLSCSSHIDPERRKAICVKSELSKLKYPDKAKMDTELTDEEMNELDKIIDKGMSLEDNDILGSMASILDIVTGHENQLKGDGKTVLGLGSKIAGFFYKKSGVNNIGTSRFSRRLGINLRRVKA